MRLAKEGEAYFIHPAEVLPLSGFLILLDLTDLNPSLEPLRQNRWRALLLARLFIATLPLILCSIFAFLFLVVG